MLRNHISKTPTRVQAPSGSSIDFEVWKALTAQLESPSDSYNNVLRRILELPGREPVRVAPPEAGSWQVGGVTFSHGTEFRGRRKGKTHSARVDDGALVYDGRRFDSPSAAASAIAEHAVNGWKFWECHLPGRGWTMIDSLRSR